MKSEVVTLGETMGLVRPQGRGRLRHCRHAELSIGGAESNVAIGVTRLGHGAAWIGRVGADPWGTLVLDELRAEGVDVSYACVDARRPTGVMLKHRSIDGSTSVSYLRSGSAGSAICPEDLHVEAIAGARILHVTGITPALSSSAAAAVDQAVSIAHDAGCRISLDLNFRSRLWTAAAAGPVLRNLIAEADIVFAAEDEVGLVVDARTPEGACHAIAELGPKHAIVKRGGAGALAVISGELHRVNPVAVEHVVDPVGAGDAFAAAYLVGILEDRTAGVALALAAKAGALAVTGTGDWEGSLDRDGLESVLAMSDAVHR